MEENSMYNRGFYSYKTENVDIKTLYTVEYTRDQKVIKLMDTAQFDYNMLSKKEFDYLEDAVSFFNTLYYSESVLHIVLYEQVILNGEIVLEQFKDCVLPTVLDKISAQRVKRAEAIEEEYKMENEKLKKFLVRHGVNPDKIKDND